jgi:uncharacterized membrane protein SirB2
MVMAKIKQWLRWLFQDLTQRRGKYVIAEVPNWPLLTFMIALILSISIYPGTVQKMFSIIAYLALIFWGFLEWRSGRSRFRKLLGILGMIGVIGAIVLGLGV